jgi:hypothetical protein
MAHVILVCSRSRTNDPSLVEGVNHFCNHLAPDNITPDPPHISDQPGLLLAIVNPGIVEPGPQGSACLGHIAPPDDTWWNVGHTVPDGSYALFRSDDHTVEILTDIVASRIVWYCQTDEMFIASTSQRALVALLGNFQFDESVLAWMLSSGTLGPEGRWDKRLQRIWGDTRLSLNRDTWELTLHEQPVSFSPADRSEKEWNKDLLDVLQTTIASYHTLKWDDWMMTLSGGGDSRALLWLLLQQQVTPRCFTVGRKESLTTPHNDAFVARALAERFGLEHQYFNIDTVTVSPETVLKRYITISEGQTDQMASFIDGFDSWQLLHEQGIKGVAFGHQAFGLRPCFSARDVRLASGFLLLNDVFSEDLVRAFDLTPQELSERMQQREGESLATWRDRLYHTARIPIVISPLDNAMSAYVETISPLRSRPIIHFIRQMPDSLRTSKYLFQEVIRTMIPDMEFAKYRAELPAADVLRTDGFVAALHDELHSAHAQTVLPDNLRHYVLQRLPQQGEETASPSILTHARNMLPKKFKSWLRKMGAPLPGVPPALAAFRVALVSTTTRMLAEDAQAFKKAQK